ncbi:MAG: neutral zinc metallopeptidase [Deltaproteobacteria bacterium]
MKWQGRRGSGNVEDRRGMGRGMAFGGVGGGAGIVILLIVLLLGGDPSAVLNQAGDTGYGSGLSQEQQDRAARFASVVLADTEDVWRQQFRDELGRTYQEPRIVLYTDSVQSACGSASSSVGPFYCPADAKVYIDLSFFDELSRRFGAPGDFAQAYVIAHEVGHHIQNQLGISDAVHTRQQRVAQKQANELSVRLELQADFLAGVWAHYARRTLNVLEPGDLQEALRAATAIGDDTLQKQQQGYAVPDSFTHGTSAQRARWFKLGFDSGDLAKGDTFGAPWGEL